MESITAAFGREPVSENVLLFCEWPAFFLNLASGSAVGYAISGAMGQLAAAYDGRLQGEPFIWHDMLGVRDHTMPISELLDRHGAPGVYLTVSFHDSPPGWHESPSIYKKLFRRDAHAEAHAVEIVRFLTSAARPWIHENAIARRIGVVEHDHGDVVNRGNYFAAALLLTLPLIEFVFAKDAAWAEFVPDMVSPVAMVCAAARLGEVPAQRVRDELVPRAVPAAVADFVVRWANKEFSLLAED